MQSLFAPWRYSYLVEARTKGECVFCTALGRPDDESSLIVHRGTHNFVILNLYPYTNGHLMIVPNSHVAFPGDSTPEQRAEMIELASLCEQALRSAYQSDGINMGMNLGKAAGAGVENHYHLHVLPRWEGDTNFMAITAQTRVIPEALASTRDRLRAELARYLAPSDGPANV